MLEDILSQIQDDIASGDYDRAIEKIQTISHNEYGTEQLLQKAILPLLKLEQSYHIVIFGDFYSGKTKFKSSVCNFPQGSREIRIRFDEREDTLGYFEVGCIKFDEDILLCLWSPPNTTHWSRELFQPLIQTGHLLGCIALIDSIMVLDDRVSGQIIDYIIRQNDRLFEEYLPYVVVANKQDHPDAPAMDDLRKTFRIRDDEKFLPCNALDEVSVKRVLLELLSSAQKDIEEVILIRRLLAQDVQLG